MIEMDEQIESDPSSNKESTVSVITSGERLMNTQEEVETPKCKYA